MCGVMCEEVVHHLSHVLLLPDIHGSDLAGGGGDGGKNDSYCWVCHEGGEVLCCDKCPRVFHFRCTKLDQEPEGEEWYCSVCTVGSCVCACVCCAALQGGGAYT